MKFELRHPLPRPVDVAWKGLFSEAYFHAASQGAEQTTEVLEEGPRGSLQYSKTKVTSHRELPSMMRKAVGARHLSYVLEQWRDDSKHEMRWKVTPPVHADKIKAEGVYRMVATPSGCERLVSGEISVSIRFVGSTIENAIGGELRSSYEQSAVFAASWLEQNT